MERKLGSSYSVQRSGCTVLWRSAWHSSVKMQRSPAQCQQLFHHLESFTDVGVAAQIVKQNHTYC